MSGAALFDSKFIFAEKKSKNDVLELRHRGKNATIYSDAKIICPENIWLGDETVIDDYAILYGVGKGIHIGNFCHVTFHCIIQAGGHVRMGDFSGIGPRTTILAASDDYEGKGFIGLKVLNEFRNLHFEDVIIGRHVHIGTGCTILSGVTIGEGCSVGAGSLVTKSLPPWTICYGSPCRPMRDKPSEIQLQMEREFLAGYYSE